MYIEKYKHESKNIIRWSKYYDYHFVGEEYLDAKNKDDIKNANIEMI